MYHRFTHRIGKGKEQVWYHDNFLRGKPEDIKLMVRTKIKGNLNSEDVKFEPNFHDLPPLPVCNKLPSAIINAMENVILKMPTGASGAVGRRTSTMPTVAIPQLGNVTGGSNRQMVLQRTETPCQFSVNCNQDESLQCLPPPPFHRAVTNEGQAMMNHCVPAIAMRYYSPLQEGSMGSTQPLNMHETSAQGPHHHHHSEHYHMLHDNLNCENDEDFEPLPFTFTDDNVPCDDFASFIEGAIQQIETE